MMVVPIVELVGRRIVCPSAWFFPTNYGCHVYPYGWCAPDEDGELRIFYGPGWCGRMARIIGPTSSKYGSRYVTIYCPLLDGDGRTHTLSMSANTLVQCPNGLHTPRSSALTREDAGVLRIPGADGLPIIRDPGRMAA